MTNFFIQIYDEYGDARLETLEEYGDDEDLLREACENIVSVNPSLNNCLAVCDVSIPGSCRGI